MKFHVNVFIMSASRVQKPQFWANFDIWGLLYRTPFADESQILCAGGDPRYTLTYEISCECVLCVGFRGPKPQFWTNFDIGGAPLPIPFYR